MPLYVRHPDLAVMVRNGTATFVLPGKPPLALEAVADAARLSAGLQALRTPRSMAEVEAFLDLRDVFMLVANGFLVAGEDAEQLAQLRGPSSTSAKPCRRLVFGITGAIGAVNAVPLVWHLVRHFAERVDVVLTESATRIVRPEVFGYLGVEAWTDAFESRGAVNVPHIHLASADLVVVAPASAHTIHNLATAACSDLLSLIVAATKAPVVVAPSMNEAMWTNTGISENVAVLRRRGFAIVEPGEGLEVSDGTRASWAFGPANLEANTWSALLGALLAKKEA